MGGTFGRPPDCPRRRVRFLVDAQLPPAVCEFLRARGHEAEHVAVALRADAPDRDVEAYAVRVGAVLVTKDRDFVDRAVGCPVLWVRIGNATKRTLIPWLAARWLTVEHIIANGERVVELI